MQRETNRVISLKGSSAGLRESAFSAHGSCRDVRSRTAPTNYSPNAQIQDARVEPFTVITILLIPLDIPARVDSRQRMKRLRADKGGI